MKEKNSLSHDISLASEDANKDAPAKTLLRYKAIAAHILKGCVREFENISVKDIEEKYIQKEPFEEEREIHGFSSSGSSEKITGQSNENSIVGEGKVFFDLIFYAYLPGEDTMTKFIINLEPQNKFNPGYPLVKRGFFYGARLISSQYGTEFSNSDYGNIKKVISIWICINPDKKYRDSMNRYRITEENVVGNVKLNSSDYDIMEVIVVCLHRNYEEDNNHNKLINMLSVLFAPDLENEKKQDILENQYDIELTTEYRKAMNDVGANLFELYIDAAEEKGFNKGVEHGIAEGKELGIAEGKELGIAEGKELGIAEGKELGIAEGKALEKIQTIKNMLENGATDEIIIKFLNVSEDELKKIKLQILKSK